MTSRLDYSGIAVLIVGSYWSPMFYGFCNRVWGYIYIFGITSIGSFAIYLSWSDAFTAPGKEYVRTFSFIAIAFFAVIPIPHSIVANGFWFMWPIIQGHLWMGFFYISGAMIYLYRIPERFAPGRYDCTLNSHTIWHLFVIAAAVKHYFNLQMVYLHRLNNTCT